MSQLILPELIVNSINHYSKMHAKKKRLIELFTKISSNWKEKKDGKYMFNETIELVKDHGDLSENYRNAIEDICWIHIFDDPENIDEINLDKWFWDSLNIYDQIAVKKKLLKLPDPPELVNN